MFKQLKVFLSKLNHIIFDLESENNCSPWKFSYDIKEHVVHIVFRVSRLSSIKKEGKKFSF